MSYPPPPGSGGYPPPSNPPGPPGYGAPVMGGVPAPGAPGYGVPPGYGAPPAPPGYGAPPGYAAPPGYGAPPAAPGYGAPPAAPGYGAPPGYGGPPAPGYGAPPAAPGYVPGYGVPPQSGQAPGCGQPFYIRSEMHGKVVDISGADKSPGAKVIIWPRKPHKEDNQLWYLDHSQCIRSKLNDFALESSHGTFKVNPYDPNNRNQQWIVQGNRIVNRNKPNEVLDIARQDKKDGAELCAWEYNGGKNQLFSIDYV